MKTRVSYIYKNDKGVYLNPTKQNLVQQIGRHIKTEPYQGGCEAGE